MKYVWTVQGDAGEDAAWLVGGVFSTFENACEFAERWASDKPGLAVYVYRWPLDITDTHDGDEDGQLVRQETLYCYPGAAA